MTPSPRARVTGVVYLLYFLTAVSAEVFVGPGRLVLYHAVNLVAYAFYISVTLLFYWMFKPVNRGLSRGPSWPAAVIETFTVGSLPVAYAAATQATKIMPSSLRRRGIGSTSERQTYSHIR